MATGSTLAVIVFFFYNKIINVGAVLSVVFLFFTARLFIGPPFLLLRTFRCRVSGWGHVCWRRRVHIGSSRDCWIHRTGSSIISISGLSRSRSNVVTARRLSVRTISR